ncbi:PREDICTED: uncharacterized protein LOC109363602 [Lupinus angustifolius]|uniref:uncharacterized protein LOC109363602 n=1 Tax=Lupinus angustifolius TaxID=3871 RepID=UPI00092F15F1|nr:PREDICTED: uncharacterized protein LOC109363602 [Lupinus angustifolius]
MCANYTLSKFNILKQFKVKINYNKVPKILEVLWNHPPPGWIKINSDEVAHSSHGHASGGAIFRNNSGDMLDCFASYFDIPDSLYAKMLAAIMTIEISHYKGCSNIWLECDSSLVGDIFKGGAMIPWKLLCNCAHCRHLIRLMNFRISHIFREGNICVVKLASFGVVSREYSSWNSIPEFLMAHFHRNKISLPKFRFKNL